ncbi:MAG: response regulator [Planctomycetes bacterium]|nr:response regulator [Planctomycetota bacterium]
MSHSLRSWRFLSLLVLVLGAAMSALGLALLTGLYLQHTLFGHWVGSIVPLHFNFALGFLFCGTALLLCAGGWPRLAIAFVGVAVVVSVLGWIESFFGIDAGLDRVISEQYFSVERFYFGGVARTTALCFALTGAALLIVRRSSRLRTHPWIWKSLVFIILLLGISTLLGYFHIITSAYDWGNLVRLILFTAAGFAVLSVAFIALGRDEEKIREGGTSRWVTVPVSIGVLATMLCLWQALLVQQKAQLERVIESEASAARKAIASQLSVYGKAIDCLSYGSVSLAAAAVEDWKSDARSCLQSFPGFTRIEYADASLKLVDAVENGPLGASPDLGTPLRVRPQVLLESLRPPAQGAAELPVFWTRWENRLLACKPLIHRSELRGFICGTLDTQRFLVTALQGEPSPGYSVAVLDAGEQLFARMDTTRELEKSWASDRSFLTSNLAWRVRVWPTPAVLSSLQSPLPDVALLVGLLMAWLFLWTLHLVRMVQAHAREIHKTQESLEKEIQERRQAEEALSRAKKQLSALVENLPEGVVLLDARRRIVLTNPAAQAHLQELTPGRLDGDLTGLGGKPLDAILSPSEGKEWHELKTRGASSRVFEIASRKVGTPEHPDGLILVLREVTRERSTQERLLLQERLASVGQLAAGIAHDFNNVLQVILGFTDLLKSSPEVPAGAKRYLESIREQGLRAARMNRQILDFSRQSPSERAPLDLYPFVKEVVKLLRNVIPETIDLHLDGQSGEYWVEADVTQLQQVFMNLAVNARDAMPRGGRLSFGLARLPLGSEDTPPYPGMPAGDWVHLTVSDTGTGIPPEVLPRIFEPFFTTKDRTKGTGLGLAQVYGIVKQHSGYIVAESVVKQGATFHLYFPALQRKETRQSRSAGPVAEGRGETILLAEDEPMVLAVTEAMLEALGYSVYSASNGRLALEVYEQHRDEIALVITDAIMPDMDGMSLALEIRARDSSLPVVMMTGYPKNEDVRSFLSRGIIGWVQKPVELTRLAQVVENALRGNPAATVRS